MLLLPVVRVVAVVTTCTAATVDDDDDIILVDGIIRRDTIVITIIYFNFLLLDYQKIQKHATAMVSCLFAKSHLDPVLANTV